jgi:hypothetical protein
MLKFNADELESTGKIDGVLLNMGEYCQPIEEVIGRHLTEFELVKLTELVLFTVPGIEEPNGYGEDDIVEDTLDEFSNLTQEQRDKLHEKLCGLMDWMSLSGHRLLPAAAIQAFDGHVVRVTVSSLTACLVRISPGLHASEQTLYNIRQTHAEFKERVMEAIDSMSGVDIDLGTVEETIALLRSIPR